MDDAQVSRAPKFSSVRWVWFLTAVARAGVLLATLCFCYSILMPEREKIAAPSPSSLPPAQSEKQKTTATPQLHKEKVPVTLAPPQTPEIKQTKPAPAPDGPSETGRASWYELQATTASGEAMDEDALTAAHPSLPLGTKVLVENLDNGRSVIVRINDRGPFARNRIIDVSKAAAEKLDMIADGVANVRIRRVEALVSDAQAPR
jgi:rare lipoprotein A